MKKMRKGKKVLLILLALVVVAIAVVIVLNIVNKRPETPEVPGDTQQVIPLPETTYSDMEVKNVSMEYLKNNDETMVSMEIHNTTKKKVENDYLTANLIGPNDEVLGKMPTWIESLDVGEVYEISVILKGDLTTTTQIKLVKN
jgi:hypothetical protein